jgi:hypothetical protein
MTEGVETGVAIVAAVHAGTDGAQQISFDRSATMRRSGFDAVTIGAPASAGDGQRLAGGAAQLQRGEFSFGHSGG